MSIASWLASGDAWTLVAVVAVVLAVVALVRRALRMAMSLLVLSVLGGAAPLAFGGQSGIGDRVREAIEAVTGLGDGAGGRVRAVDGDTFKLSASGGDVTVRVALVDAGESSSQRYGHPTCGGSQAKRFAERWADRHDDVRLRGVAGLPARDRYDRRLARVLDDQGRDYGLAAVRSGWARVVVYETPRNTGAAYLLRLRAAEATARAEGRGAWQACDAPAAVG